MHRAWLEERATSMAMHAASASFGAACCDGGGGGSGCGFGASGGDGGGGGGGIAVPRAGKAGKKPKKPKKAAAPPPKKLRVLSLHGYGQNAAALQSKMGALRRAAKASADFVFVEGPFPAAARADGDGEAAPTADIRSWWNFTRGEEPPRYRGWEEARAAVLAEARRGGPFDAVLGFSQGASAAALLCAEGDNAELWAPRLAGGGGGVSGAAEEEVGATAAAAAASGGAGIVAAVCHLPRAAMLFSGFVPRDAAFGAPLLLAPLPVPSLHVMGTSDEIIAVARSRELARCFEAPAELLHEGGHLVPSFAGVRHAFKQFVVAHAAGLGPP